MRRLAELGDVGAAAEVRPARANDDRFDAPILARFGERMDEAGADGVAERVDRRIFEQNDGDRAIASKLYRSCQAWALPVGFAS